MPAGEDLDAGDGSALAKKHSKRPVIAPKPLNCMVFFAIDSLRQGPHRLW
jgi:hypothetical protein